MHSNAKHIFENQCGLILTDECVGIFIFSCCSQVIEKNEEQTHIATFLVCGCGDPV